MGKLPSQPEYVQKESCQVITLRSGKEVEKDLNKKKRVVDDDDERVEIKEVDVRSKQNDESAKKSTKGVVITPINDEPKVDVKTLPFFQRFIRRNLDKKFGKFLDYLKEITITIPFMDSIRDMSAWSKFLKDIISHKIKLEDYGLVSLVEESKTMFYGSLCNWRYVFS